MKVKLPVEKEDWKLDLNLNRPTESVQEKKAIST